MVKFSGYHPDRVYASSKPIKYGFRIYILAASENGFVFQYFVAVRKKGDKKDDTKNPKTELICYSLLQPYTNKGYSVYFDSYLYITFDVFDPVKSWVQLLWYCPV